MVRLDILVEASWAVSALDPEISGTSFASGASGFSADAW